MESPRLLTEVCEAILDTIPLPISRSRSLEYPYVARSRYLSDSILNQKTFYACALVCHAWRTHAQFLLWKYPMLQSQASLARFIATVHHDVGNLSTPDGQSCQSAIFSCDASRTSVSGMDDQPLLVPHVSALLLLPDAPGA
ncbi:hypothetical protein BD414DRAFT_477598 [Trametes punicea]|nr:hypothetical protein BD414DRAFT_477598 [Trametes punicea]